MSTIKSVKMVDGILEIVISVSNGFLTEEVKWEYVPSLGAQPERVSSDSPMNDTIGYLILGLLQGTILDPVTKCDVADAADELETLLG